MRWRVLDADITVPVPFAVPVTDARTRAGTCADSESSAHGQLADAFLRRAVADAWHGRLRRRRGLPGS